MVSAPKIDEDSQWGQCKAKWRSSAAGVPKRNTVNCRDRGPPTALHHFTAMRMRLEFARDDGSRGRSDSTIQKVEGNLAPEGQDRLENE